MKFVSIVKMTRLKPLHQFVAICLVSLLLLQSLGLLAFFHAQGVGSEIDDFYHLVTEHSLAVDKSQPLSADTEEPSSEQCDHHAAHPCHFFHYAQFLLSQGHPTFDAGPGVLTAPASHADCTMDGCKISLFRPPRLV